VIAEGVALPTAKRLFAAVHSASVANGTVVMACEAPPPGLAFTTALNSLSDRPAETDRQQVPQVAPVLGKHMTTRP
jgi:hypothetical protein